MMFTQDPLNFFLEVDSKFFKQEYSNIFCIANGGILKN